MLDVEILLPEVRKSVTVQVLTGGTKLRAVLLGQTGEQLQVFGLPGEINILSLDGFSAGMYALRIESGAEVIVKQIIIP